MEYSKEQLNYFRVCYVVTDLLTEGLRIIFKQEWDNLYRATPSGEWKDEPKNGVDFKNKESVRNRNRNARILKTMIGGNRAEWDCTMLFYAILFSDCIYSLSPVVRLNVDALRKFRNEDFAHMSEGNLSDLYFQNIIGNVHTAFQALGLSTIRIQEMKNQTSFPTEELGDIFRKVKDLKNELLGKDQELQEKEEERQVLEDQLNRDISPFCILPPKPSHDVTSRDREVAEIMQDLKALKKANQHKLSYLYISGNPGSGKSQLAGLVAEQFYQEVKDLPSKTLFVMTINGESLDTMLESYLAFSRRLKCPEYSVTNTLHSEDLSIIEKIAHLKTLIGTKIRLYTSWLLVVDNVTSITHAHFHLPEAENKVWAEGQLLITTQDGGSIPQVSSFNKHISISKGMHFDDVSCLLENLSGIKDKGMEIKVAQALDYQPLALASAAAYVREVRQISKFGWEEYLAKLETGQRNAMENFFVKVNPSYPKSMIKATALAVANAMASNKAIYYAFNFLSLCAPQPLSLNIIEDFIASVDEESQDKETVRLEIQRCSLVMFEREETGVYIRVHQVVHNSIKTEVVARSDDTPNEVVIGVIGSFTRFVNGELYALRNSRHVVPHLLNLATELERYFSEKSQVHQSGFLITQNDKDLLGISRFCYRHTEYETSRRFLNIVLAIRLKKLGSEHVEVATSYSKLGSVYKKLGDLSQAKDYHHRALAIRLKKLGSEHVDVAASYSKLGSVHKKLGDLSQAKDYHDRALAIRLKKLESEHVDVAASYSSLGSVHKKLGDPSQAKNFHDRALAIRLEKLGSEHVDVAASYSNLGSVHFELGDQSQGKDFHDHALAIRLKKLGSEHVDVAASYSKLGFVHKKLGNLSQAKDYHDRALAIRLKKLGSDHVDVAASYSKLGSVHKKLGELNQAKDYHDRALAIRLEKLGSEHVDVAASYSKLGSVHFELGELSQAKDYHHRALAIRLKKLGSEHVDVAVSYSNLGFLHYELGELNQAKDCHDRALAFRLKSC